MHMWCAHQCRYLASIAAASQSRGASLPPPLRGPSHPASPTLRLAASPAPRSPRPATGPRAAAGAAPESRFLPNYFRPDSAPRWYTTAVYLHSIVVPITRRVFQISRSEIYREFTRKMCILTRTRFQWLWSCLKRWCSECRSVRVISEWHGTVQDANKLVYLSLNSFKAHIRKNVRNYFSF